MRLALAASALATTALPTGLSIQQKATDPSSFATRFKIDNDQKNDIQQLLFSENFQQSFFGSSWSSTPVLKNAKVDNTIVECDPDDDEEEADIGVLACGTNEYCMEVPDSSLGGVCVSSATTATGGMEHRMLELQGRGDSICGENPALFCDCTSWNSSLNTGIIQCARRYGCYESCGDTYYCLDDIETYVNDGTSAMRSRFRGFSGTFDSNLTFVGERDSNGDYFCEMAVNGTACTYCAYSNSTCVSFDCTNVGQGFKDCESGSGDGVALTWPPPTCNYTMQCSLCAEGEYLVEEDTYVELISGAYPCGFLYNFTENFETLVSNSRLCGYLVAYGRGPCCE